MCVGIPYLTIYLFVFIHTYIYIYIYIYTYRVLELGFVELEMDVTVRLSDQSHRDQGLWAFDTVNPNVWPGVAEYLAGTSADGVMMQDTTVDGASVEEIEATTKRKGWRTALSGCLYGEGGGKSAGVAVACRSHVGPSETGVDRPS